MPQSALKQSSPTLRLRSNILPRYIPTIDSVRLKFLSLLLLFHNGLSHLKSFTQIVVLTVMTNLAKGANRLRFQIYFFTRISHWKQVAPQELSHYHFRTSVSGVRDGTRATEKEREGSTSKIIRHALSSTNSWKDPWILHHWPRNFVNIIHSYLSDLQERLEGQRGSSEGWRSWRGST